MSWLSRETWHRVRARIEKTFLAGTIWLSVHSYWTSFFSSLSHRHPEKSFIWIWHCQFPAQPNRCVMSFTKHNFYFVLSQKLIPFFEIIICTFCWLTDKFEAVQKLSTRELKKNKNYLICLWDESERCCRGSLKAFIKSFLHFQLILRTNFGF